MKDQKDTLKTKDSFSDGSRGFDSPESLEGYIKTVSPASFLLVFALLLYFVALIVFSSTDSLEGELSLPAICDEGEMSVYFGAENYNRVKNCERVIINGHVFFIPEADEVTQEMDTNDYLYMKSNKNIKDGEKLYVVRLSTDFPDGNYDASVILDEKRPLDEF